MIYELDRTLMYPVQRVLHLKSFKFMVKVVWNHPKYSKKYFKFFSFSSTFANLLVHVLSVESDSLCFLEYLIAVGGKYYFEDAYDENEPYGEIGNRETELFSRSNTWLTKSRIPSGAEYTKNRFNKIKGVVAAAFHVPSWNVAAVNVNSKF